MVFRANVQVFGEGWWLQLNFGIFSTRQGTGIACFHAEVKPSSEDIKLRHVIGFSLMFLEEQAARGPGLTNGFKSLVRHWKPWKLLNGLGNFAIYHPFLTYNMLHHVGSVLQAPKAFLSCLKVEGPTFPLSAAIPWSSERMCSFRRGLMAATEFWHLFDTPGDWNLILPCGSRIIQWRH